MDNNRKAALFAALAAICAASTAPLAADQSINHGFLVLPLVLMGILLFVAGYYSGQARSKR
jgi:urea transporter